MGLGPTAVADNMLVGCVSLHCWMCKESILRALLANASNRRSSKVSKSPFLRHLTKNVSAISIDPSASCGQSKCSIKVELSALRTVLRAASLVDIVLVVSQPVSAWSAGRHFVSLSPSALHIAWSGSTDLFTPELRISQSSWRPSFLQLTMK